MISMAADGRRENQYEDIPTCGHCGHKLENGKIKLVFVVHLPAAGYNDSQKRTYGGNKNGADLG